MACERVPVRSGVSGFRSRSHFGQEIILVVQIPGDTSPRGDFDPFVPNRLVLIRITFRFASACWRQHVVLTGTRGPARQLIFSSSSCHRCTLPGSAASPAVQQVVTVVRKLTWFPHKKGHFESRGWRAEFDPGEAGLRCVPSADVTGAFRPRRGWDRW